MKIKNYFLNACFIFMLSYSIQAQNIVYHGTVMDNGEPLIAATVLIKGTTTGVVTDFDGKYKISCKVGDILVISYTGYDTQELVVTAEMLNSSNKRQKKTPVKIVPVQAVYSKAYTKAIEEQKTTIEVNTPDIRESKTTISFSDNNRHNIENISNIKIKDDVIFISKKLNRVQYSVGLNHHSIFTTVAKKHIIKTQSTYAQGQNGQWTGADQNQAFAFGPALNLLEFDGSSYAYDTNGRLVSNGMGNGNPAIAYHNPLFQNAYAYNNQIFLKTKTKKLATHFSYTRQEGQNILGQKNNYSNSIQTKINLGKKYHKGFYQLHFNYNDSKNEMPNHHGIYNKSYLAHLLNPPSFNTKNNLVINDGLQMSFSPNQYNHPNWLSEYSSNTIEKQRFSTMASATYHYNDFNFGGKLSYNNSKQATAFQLAKHTIGFEEGLYSFKTQEEEQVSFVANFNWSNHFYLDDYVNFNLSNSFLINQQLVDYQFGVYTLDDAIDVPNRLVQRKNTTRHFYNAIEIYNYKYFELFYSQLFSHFSLVDKKAWQPDMSLTYRASRFFNNILNLDFINRQNIYINYNHTYNLPSLVYSGTNHNNLNNSPENAQAFFIQNDLFAHDELSLEKNKNLIIRSTFNFIEDLNFVFEYEKRSAENIAFPIYNGSTYRLENIANIDYQNYSINLSKDFGQANKGLYRPSLNFSIHRNEVKGLNNQNNIPIAGFNNIQQQLIVGQPVGVIVGTSLEKTANGTAIIESNGYPKLNAATQVIADPTADFNLSLDQGFTYKSFQASILLQYQHGGKIWNGTHQVLNYHGMSQQTAEQRTIENYVFDGQQIDGSVNNIPVALDQNYWQNYGYSGVGSEAIEDGSFLSLKNVMLSYQFKNKKGNKPLKLTLYGENLWVLTSFEGANPYSSLFGQSNSSALHFFNTPILSTFGLKLNWKV